MLVELQVNMKLSIIINFVGGDRAGSYSATQAYGS